MVTDGEAARILTDTAQLRLLEPFFKRETTLSDAAAELSVRLNTLLYRVNKFVELGLLTVVREEPRRGKAVKVYRASAEDFFVPFDVMASSSLEELLVNLLGDTEKIFYREAAKAFHGLRYRRCHTWATHLYPAASCGKHCQKRASKLSQHWRC